MPPRCHARAGLYGQQAEIASSIAAAAYCQKPCRFSSRHLSTAMGGGVLRRAGNGHSPSALPRTAWPVVIALPSRVLLKTNLAMPRPFPLGSFSSRNGARMAGVDALRGVAMVWMTIFHFCFDLSHFGYWPQNFRADPFWTTQRTAIVGLFLFCAGLGQALAWNQGLGWDRFSSVGCRSWVVHCW